MHFDWTINLGNIITGATFLMLSIVAWRDLTWRIKNLETWRKEHMVESNSRDIIILRIDTLLQRLDAIFGDRRNMFVRSEHPEPYYGEERRGRK